MTSTICNIIKQYDGKIDFLDLELIIAHVLKKSREFVLAHREYKLTRNQESGIMNYAKRRLRGEPLAYIMKHKEFYGLNFKVNKNVLIPRPETEILVGLALQEFQETRNKKQETILIDIGTGSGNIIISIASNTRHATNDKVNFYGVDISGKALKIAKQNAKIHRVDKKIKFLKGNLLSPFIKSKSCKLKAENLIITANLPYLSPKIYKNTPKSVKNYEPKTALCSAESGLAHYKKLIKQISNLKAMRCVPHAVCYMEISPEQKNLLTKLIKKYLPKSKIKFYKDLAGKWRVCNFEF